MGWIVAGLLALGATLTGPLMSRVETPPYRLVDSDGAIEIRDYAAQIVAQVEESGTREAALRRGFRALAGYIFGGNTTAGKLAMTAPVTQAAGARIAMTAPVAQQAADGVWRVRFIMPAGYTLDTLPAPTDPAVHLLEIAPKRVAVIRFTGLAGEASLARHTAELQRFLRARGLRPVAEPSSAYYNPPWTLPFLRRNEVMIEIAP